ncbi:secondary thiamine-phosphate synthase enzyme YjbQ [Candidatus Hydrogenedentota bacterium]
MHEFAVRSKSRTQMIDITSEVRRAIEESNVQGGVCHVFTPHTTAGITINENADPDVTVDLVNELNKIVPFEDGYRHMEGNSAAHLKSTLTGCSETVIINSNRAVLGTWQGIYFCEFDGPRTRRVCVKIISDER